MDYICQACNKNLSNAAGLNKHLSNCEKYTEWLKTYTPPVKKCENCKKEYSLRCIEEHLINCVNKKNDL